LGQSLAFDDPLAVVAELALAKERLQYRSLGLFRLEEEWIVVVAAEEEDDPGAGADAPDPDNLPSRIDVAVSLDQPAPVGWKRPPVRANEETGTAPRTVKALAGADA
jgi:hypothetical protein